MPPAEPGQQNRLLAVASGKGGVGKTWLSATLAHAMAFEGARVLLFDGDLGLANVDVQLGLSPQGDLSAVLEGRLPLDQAVTPVQGGAGERGGFDVLAGSSGSGALATVPRAELLALVSNLRLIATRYDRVLIDLGAGLDRNVTTLCAAAGDTLVVLTDEPTSLTDAYALIKVLRLQGYAGRVRIAVNQAFSESDGKRTFAALEKACRSFLHFAPELAGVVRRDSKVRDAIRAQTPLLARHPQAQAAHDVAALAKRLWAAGPERAAGAA